MLIILISSLRKGEIRSTSRVSFVALIITTTLGLGFDALSYILEEGLPDNLVLSVTLILSFSLINLCLIAFSFYLFSIIRRTRNISILSFSPVMAVCGINISLILIGALSGDFFIVRDHQILYGPWKDPILVMPVASVVLLLITLLMNLRFMGIRNTLVLGSFAAFPLFAAIIVFFFSEMQFAYLSAALSCEIIFTFIRREEITRAQVREEIMRRISSKDSLTGLMNRRGFDDAVRQSSDHEWLGVVFGDLNALKYTNDNFGHASGDAYIRRFADLLRQIFENFGPICRISGDEFVVLLYDISEPDFNGLMKKTNEAIRNNDRIASVGYAYGGSSKASELIKHAEKEMYNAKNRFYRETGMKRRGITQ